jgi:AraC-like DNA-binding protein/mannose-6-phosphate isomerase-like protein (cupin superfamily)
MNDWKTEYNEQNKYFSAQFDIENMNVLFILNECFFIASRPYFPIPHSHENHEFFFVETGRCAINIKGKNCRLNGGSFIWIPAGTEHNIYYIAENTRIFPVQMQFYKNELKTENEEINIDIFDILNTLIISGKFHIFDDCGGIWAKIKEVLTTIENKTQFLYRECCLLAIKAFLIKVFEYMQDMYKTLKTSPAENIETAVNAKNKLIYINIIEDYLDGLFSGKKKISLAGLAGRLKLSVRHTRRLLKSVYGMTFYELTAHTRVNMAKLLLIETSLPAKEISEYTGYSSYSIFYRAFHGMTKMSPAEFKKRGMNP